MHDVGSHKTALVAAMNCNIHCRKINDGILWENAGFDDVVKL